MAYVFAACVLIVTAGVIWFHIVRPILEDYGIIRVESESESVNHSQAVMSSIQEGHSADERTDDTDGRVSAPSMSPRRTQLDRTRSAVIEQLLTDGWTITDMRREGVLRGENAAISAEVDAARQRLGIGSPERQLRVKDERGERLISLER